MAPAYSGAFFIRMNSKRTKRGHIILTLKGMAMGAADVVPGVSGGTIAFITGIYEELLGTFSKLDLKVFGIWKNEGFKAMWTYMNGPFLVALFSGIFISIASLSYVIKYLLEFHPIQLWAFFFGLIIASVFLVGKQVKKKKSSAAIVGLISGTIVAYLITLAAPTTGSESLLYVLLCGMLAICAMILPGISGSFILLLLGAYTTILGSVSGLIDGLRAGLSAEIFDNGIRLAVFAVGCLLGLIGFSRVLTLMFNKAHDLTVAVLTGFLIGSLNKIWPWKETLEVFIKHEGEPNEKIIPMVQQNISPERFTQLFEEPNHLYGAIAFCVLGILLISMLDRFAPKEA